MPRSVIDGSNAWQVMRSLDLLVQYLRFWVFQRYCCSLCASYTCSIRYMYMDMDSSTVLDCLHIIATVHCQQLQRAVVRGASQSMIPRNKLALQYLSHYSFYKGRSGITNLNNHNFDIFTPIPFKSIFIGGSFANSWCVTELKLHRQYLMYVLTRNEYDEISLPQFLEEIIT